MEELRSNFHWNSGGTSKELQDEVQRNCWMKSKGIAGEILEELRSKEAEAEGISDEFLGEFME